MEKELDKSYANPLTVRAKASDEARVHQTICALSARARQINEDIRLELDDALSEFHFEGDLDKNNNNSTERTDDTFEKMERIRIVQRFEKLPKPTFIAMREFDQGKLRYELNEEEGRFEKFEDK